MADVLLSTDSYFCSIADNFEMNFHFLSQWL